MQYTKVFVILAGGSGTRLWPVSTEDRPKQFSTLFGDRSMLQQAYDRVAPLSFSNHAEHVIVVTNDKYVDLVTQQIPRAIVIGEPAQCDTAAAIILATSLARHLFPDCVMGIVTADHLIEDAELFSFQKTMLSAMEGAYISRLPYTFGVRPTYPATSYGYLELGELGAEQDGVRHYNLKSFREKPDLAKATSYVAHGGFLWNSGMMVWHADSIWSEMEKHMPDHCAVLNLGAQISSDGWRPAMESAYSKLAKISIDYGFMEKLERVRTIPVYYDWYDIGGWQALSDLNIQRGNVYSDDSSRNFIFCEDVNETVVLIGADDFIVVRSENRTLIVKKDKLDQLKQVVQSLK